MPYKPLDLEGYREKLADFAQVFMFYSEKTGVDKEQVVCNRKKLFEVFDRVEKRRYYFKEFYGLEMSERNETSLYCYWLLKLNPFFNLADTEHHINTSLAIFLFLWVLKYECEHTGRPMRVDQAYIEHLTYAFEFRDISKEAIMALAETFRI